MKSNFNIENPDGVQMTLTVTMPLYDWKLIAMSLSKTESGTAPASNLGTEIISMIAHAEQEFSPEQEKL